MNFSIITLSLNSISTIKKTVESVLNQLDKNDEYLVFDGGSTDGTIEYLENIKNENLRIFKNVKKGIYGSLNFAIRNTENDIIGIIHSDDYYSKNILPLVKQTFINKKNIHIVHGKLAKIYKDQIKIFSVFNNLDVKKTIEKLNHVHPTVFLKKEIYNEVQFSEKYKLASDMDFFLKISKMNFNSYFLNQIISHQLYGGASDLNRTAIALENLKIYFDNKLYIKGIINFIYLILKNQKVSLRYLLHKRNIF
tara:strand:+ start:1880 stop:2632 length:753 start_codon:yes stop_codon:yes gene_type:complete